MVVWYISNEYFFAATQLILAMLGMGATLKVVDFWDVLKQPKSVTTGILMQLLFIPLLALLFITVATVPLGIAVGVALVCAIPGGTVSNIFTYLAKGNIPLSISVTATTSLACLVTTPIILTLLIKEYLPTDFTMPSGQIAFEITICLLVPLVLGMCYLKFLPKTAEVFSKWCVRSSLFIIGCIVVGSASSGRINWSTFGISNILLLIGFFIFIAVASTLVLRLTGLQIKDRTAIEMEMIVRNINLGLLIKASLFPVLIGKSNDLGDAVLFTLLLYGAVQLLLGVLWIIYYRKHQSTEFQPAN